VNRLLEEQLRQALAVLAENSAGHLPRPVRYWVQDAWESDPAARRKRVELARLCALARIGRWEAERPHDRRPREMIELAAEVMAERVGWKEAGLTAGVAFNRIVELLNVEITEPAMNAGLAAVMTVDAACGPARDPTDNNENDDNELALDDLDSAYLASMVDAPSLPEADRPEINVAEHVEPRRAFWRWYLDEAVPSADRID
jgi:hypothetical protein